MSEVIEIKERGCGFPVAGGMYFSIPLGDNGVPPEYFLLDPLVPIPENLIVKDRGLTMIQNGGVYHIIDHVGSGMYPNAADWFEEVRHLGFHQHVETTLDFSKLDMAKSRYFVSHSRVMPDVDMRPRIYDAIANISTVLKVCPSKKHDTFLIDGSLGQDEVFPACVALLWSDLIKVDNRDESHSEEIDYVTRSMPSFQYRGYSLNFNVNWSSGLFASFPIASMQTLIYKGGAGEHNDSAKRAKEHGWQGEVQFVEF